MQIPSRGFPCADSVVRIHCTNSIMRVPLRKFLRENSIMRIPSCGFRRTSSIHCASILCIPSYGAHRADSIVRILSYKFHRADAIRCGRQGVGTLAHRITFVFALPLASTGMYQLRMYWVRAHRLGLYRSHCMCVVDY